MMILKSEKADTPSRRSQTCKVMHEVLDEVADDGIKNADHDEGGYDQVEDIGRQVDGVPRGRNVALKQHRPIVFRVTDI